MQKTLVKPVDADQPSLMSAFQGSTLLSLSAVLFVCVIVMLPIWWWGLPANAHDTKAHAGWQYLFSIQLWNGDIYPRWLADMNEGLGSPSFYIYPPLSQYAAAILGPFSDDPAWVYHRLGIAATAAYFISGAGAYLWLFKVTNDRVAALMGALIFLLSPYHLFVDTYMRAAYAELWAFAWAPFSLLAIHLFSGNTNHALFLYIGATVALFLSHAPSCIALIPAYIAYAAVLSLMHKEKRIVLWTLAATLLAALISGVYLGTALTHQQYINSAALFSGYNDFFRWFLGSDKRWPVPSVELVIAGTAMVQCGAGALFGFFVIKRSAPRSARRSLAFFSIFVSFAVLFLISVLSKPVWEMVPFIQKIQFPWRLLSLQTIFLALICALHVQAASSSPVVLRTWVMKRMMGAFIFFLIILNAGLILYSKPEFSRVPPLPVRDTPEYQLGSINDAKGLFGKNEMVRVIAGQGSVRLEAMAPRYIRIHVIAKTDLKFVVRHFYYPDWLCTASGKPASCHVARFNAKLPIITVTTGPGSRSMEIQLSSASERIGQLASAIGILALISLCAFNYLLGRRQKLHGVGACPEAAALQPAK